MGGAFQTIPSDLFSRFPDSAIGRADFGHFTSKATTLSQAPAAPGWGERRTYAVLPRIEVCGSAEPAATRWVVAGERSSLITSAREPYGFVKESVGSRGSAHTFGEYLGGICNFRRGRGCRDVGWSRSLQLPIIVDQVIGRAIVGKDGWCLAFELRDNPLG